MAAILHCISKFSIKSSNMSAMDMAQKAKDLGYDTISLGDYGTMFGVPKFMSACEKVGIKGIPGVTLRICDAGRNLSDLYLIPKDVVGYKAISLALTRANEHLAKEIDEGKIDAKDERAIPSLPKEDLKPIIGVGSSGYGHVFCLTGGINGVIISLAEKTSKNASLLKSYQTELDTAFMAEEIVSRHETDLAALITRKDTLSNLVAEKFGSQERAAEKMQDEKEKKKILKEIEKKKESQKKAAEELADVRKQIANIKKLQTRAKKDVISEGKIEALKAMISEMEKTVVGNDKIEEVMKNEIMFYSDLVGHDNLFVEIQPYHNTSVKSQMKTLVKLAKDVGCRIIASNEPVMLSGSEEEVDVLLALKTLDSKSKDGLEWIEADTDLKQRYMKSASSLEEELSSMIGNKKATEAIDSLALISNSCDVQFPKEDHYPRYDQNLSHEEAAKKLEEFARNGAKIKYKEWNDELEKRLQYELDVINSMGYTDYFLIVQDFLQVGKRMGHMPNDRLDYLVKNAESMTRDEMLAYIDEDQSMPGLTIGPGRGSGAGSIVCYLTGITNIDPIKYDLQFERFLNPERISMPDIDSDIANEIRDTLIEYIKKTYGKDGVAGISTISALGGKGAIRNAGRIYGAKEYGDSKAFLGLSDDISRMVEKSVRESEKELITVFKGNADALGIISLAKSIEGAFVQTGQHAAGVVISDNGNLRDYCPLMFVPQTKKWQIQMDMVECEEAGLLKMDLLGLKNLDIITKTFRQVYQEKGIFLKEEEIANDDPNVFKTLSNGDTNSVFQFESSGMKQMLRKFKPSSFEDITLLVAAYRPGPMQFLDSMTKVRHGADAQYLHPSLQPILKNTYGSIIYQEQVTTIVRDLAGYSIGQADNIRKAMSKKKENVIEEERQYFVYGDEKRNIPGAIKNGIPEETANKIYDGLIDFAKYAFNKSHAAVYARNAYLTAFLKTYYIAEFMCSVLSFTQQEKVQQLIIECKSKNVPVHVPSINKSMKELSIKDGMIYFGFTQIKSFKEKFCEKIISNRSDGPYTSVYDFLKKNIDIDKSSMDGLIESGAFDEFADRGTVANYISLIRKRWEDRKKHCKDINVLNLMIEAFDNKDKQRAFLLAGKLSSKSKTEFTKAKAQKKLESLMEKVEDIDMLCSVDWDELYAGGSVNSIDSFAVEYDRLGAYVSGSPLDKYVCPDNYSESMNEGKARFFGMIKNCKHFTAKKSGKAMFSYTLETYYGNTIDGICFDEKIAKSIKFDAGDAVIVDGRIQLRDEDDIQFITNSFTEPNVLMGSITIGLPTVADWEFEYADKIKEISEKSKQKDSTIYWKDNSLGIIRKTKLFVQKSLILSDPDLRKMVIESL